MDRPAGILLVEDSQADIDLTLHAFRSARLSNGVKVCRTGEEALDYLFRRGDYSGGVHQLPDMILLDIKLPGIDGLEVLREIKRTPVLRRIPVVILTSSAEETDRVTGYEIGANSYLVKPVRFDEFLEVARKVGNYWVTLNVAPPLD